MSLQDSLTENQYCALLFWVAEFGNPSTEGIYRVWVEPSERHRMGAQITPTDDTDYSVRLNAVSRGVFLGSGLGMLSVMQVGHRTHVTGRWESVLPHIFGWRDRDWFARNHDIAAAAAAATPEESFGQQENLDEAVPPTRMGDVTTDPDTSRATVDLGNDRPVRDRQFLAHVTTEQSPLHHRPVTPPTSDPSQPPQLLELPSFDPSNNLDLS
jgi:hypothetical protein